MEAAFREALAHQQADRLDEAEAIYRRILDYRPDWTLSNLGVILRVTGRLEEAEAMLRRGLAADPENVRTQHTLGMTLLQRGKYVEGWPLYEARHRIYGRATRDFREWQGESLRGKRVLVLGEQGFGDQILWARFLPRLAAEAADVQVAVPAAIAPLLAGMPVRLVRGDDWRTAAADVWTSLGSIPRWFEAGPDDAPTPYIAAPPGAASAARVGFMLAGGPHNPNPGRIPPPDVRGALRGLADGVDLDPQVSGARDFGETARWIAGVERVVSVDTSVAHLAGAMGKPCWTILPRPAQDWYANWSDDRTAWYPSMRTVRQRTPGDWGGVLAELARVLAAPASKLTTWT